MTDALAAQASATFPADGSAVSQARRFVRETLAGWDAGSVLDDAVLLVSELVTNAVVHAGTETEVTCSLRADAVQFDIVDRYPGRWLPALPQAVDEDSEGGRGLAMAAMLSAAWGVAYTASTKRVWFVLSLPGADRDVTDLAAPVAAAAPLPASPADLRVAVVRLATDGRIAGWGEEAAALFGWSGDDVEGRLWQELAVWADGTGPVPLEELLRLARWQGTYAVRMASGGVLPVFASHVATASGDEHSVLCLLVRVEHRALLASPPVPAPTSQTTARDDGDDVGLSDALTVRLELDDLLQRTVERARDILLADAAFVLLFAEDAEDIELRATTGLPTALPRYVRLPAETGAVGRFSSDRLPAVHEDVGEDASVMPLLAGTGMHALVTVPMLVEGRVVGTLGVAARRPGRFDNDSAVRLQRAADRVALAVQTARLVELERQRRGWLTFLTEASELLAGTLDLDMTLALVGQLVVPRLATWCAVHVDDDGDTPQLAYVWHASEDRTDDLRALLAKVPAPVTGDARSAVAWAPAAGLSLAGSELERAADLANDAAVAVPLLARGRSLGTLALGKTGPEPFRRDVLDLAEDLSRRAALALDNARVYSDRATTARALQRSLLPPAIPAVPGLDIGVVYEAAGAGNEVGGDFYDIFASGAERWGFAIGDVCGKGAEAAAVTGLARHALRILAREAHTVAGVVERLNTAILEEGPRSRFLTAVSGQLTTLASGGVRLTFVCAGHPLPLLLRTDGTVTTVGTPQTLLGVIDDVEFSSDVVDLRPGEIFVCVTDGVTERRDGARMLGDDGLAAVVATCAGLSAQAVAARIQRTVLTYSAVAPRDDMAILVLRASEAARS